jgi:hypothetical protein
MGGEIGKGLEKSPRLNHAPFKLNPTCIDNYPVFDGVRFTMTHVEGMINFVNPTCSDV